MIDLTELTATIDAAIRDTFGACLTTEAESDDNGVHPANVVDGLYCIAHALEDVARAINRLGNADASTPMGGLEALGSVMLGSADRISGSIDGLADAIRESDPEFDTVLRELERE